MSAPEEPMEQRPDLAARLRAGFPHAEFDFVTRLGPNDEMTATLEQWDADLRAAADIVEAHQRLLDAIGDPDELRCAEHTCSCPASFEMLRRIADAVDGAS